MGWFLMLGNRLQAARAAFERAENLEPGELKTQHGRWRMWVLERDWERAETEAEALMVKEDDYSK